MPMDPLQTALCALPGLASLITLVTPFVPWATIYLFVSLPGGPQMPVRMGIGGCFSKICKVAQDVQDDMGTNGGPVWQPPPGFGGNWARENQEIETFRTAAIFAWIFVAAGFLGCVHSLYSCLKGVRADGTGSLVGDLLGWRSSAVDLAAAACLVAAVVVYAAIVEPSVSTHAGHYDSGLWLALLAAVLQGVGAVCRRAREDDAYQSLSQPLASQVRESGGYSTMGYSLDEGRPRGAPSPSLSHSHNL
eukprot:Hpha_TRINITY_DN14033_c0_g1::TRINITY_DN14033_c0_g1_i1::g.44142::m.44142